jgi:hypothetical protein
MRNDEDYEGEMEQYNINDIFTNEQNNVDNIFTVSSVAGYIEFLNKRLSMNNDLILKESPSSEEASVDHADKSALGSPGEKLRERERDLMTLKGRDRKEKISIFIDNIGSHSIVRSLSERLKDVEREKDLRGLKKRNKKTSVFVDNASMDSSLDNLSEMDKDLKGLKGKKKEKLVYLSDVDDSIARSPFDKLKGMDQEVTSRLSKGRRITSLGKKNRIACLTRPTDSRHS